MLVGGAFDEFDDLASAINYDEETNTTTIDLGFGSITLQNVTGLTPENFIFRPEQGGVIT